MFLRLLKAVDFVAVFVVFVVNVIVVALLVVTCHIILSCGHEGCCWVSVVVGGGWGAMQSHFCVQPNCNVEVEVVFCCRCGCDNFFHPL